MKEQTRAIKELDLWIDHDISFLHLFIVDALILAMGWDLLVNWEIWVFCLVLHLFAVLCFAGRHGENWGAWAYRERWRVVFIGWVLPLILFQVPLTGFLFDHFRDYFSSTSGATLQFPSFAVSLPLWPGALFLWFIRDKVKEEELQQKAVDIQHKDIELLQADFHKIQERASSEQPGQVPATLRIASIHQLKRYLNGEALRDKRVNPFQAPARALLVAILASKLLGEKEQEEKDEPNDLFTNRTNFYSNEAVPVVIAIWEVIFGTANSVPYHDLVFPGVHQPGANMVEAGLRNANLFWGDFRGAKMTGADLAGIDLSWGLLSGVCLVGANLRNANLSSSDLRNADFSHACLKWAQVTDSNLSGANLTNADLMHIFVNRTNLKGANLSGANLLGVNNWKECVWAGANIYGVVHAPEGFCEHVLANGGVQKGPEA